VYMNTFYGTAGDSKSPFFLRALAGDVTSAGQRNIKLVADFVK
ncbi:12355_t:CDS:1, partial [Funneliformis mosseae]